jgi:signal transduction histidine kinase/AmiR/NasT family two-component response regulator
VSTQAELLGQTTAPALTFDDPRVARENLALLRFRPQIRAAAVYTVRGALFATYAQPGEESFPPLPASDGVHVTSRELVVFRRVISDGEIIGTVYLRADSALFDRILHYTGIAIGVAAVALLAAFLLSLWLQRIVTRPVLAIADVAREVAEQRDYSRRATRLSDDEVGTLVDSFNGMMAEIEKRAHENEASIRALADEMAERKGAQQEVMRLNQELEQRVQERTSQLESSNRELALATEAAERANRAKSEFLSSMSHELRTPLNAILGFSQLLQSSTIDTDAAKKREFATHIFRAGQHLLTLINEVLDLARIESSNLMLSMEPTAVAEVLEECETMIEPAAARRSVRVIFPQACEQSVLADRTRFRQVLLNLLSNAIKYNRDQGAVVVDCQQAGKDHVRISVQDTGAGLRTEQLQALFQPFNRLGQEAGTEEGTGIGLVVTKRLVELMNGRIGVSSTVGVGSIFWIELPAAPGVAVAQRAEERPLRSAAAPDHPIDGQKPTLLYVEDNPANLRLVEEIVAVRGDLRHISAPDAQMGIELARAHLPQVILMDINLPGLSGIDAQQILRDDPRTSHIPVIGVTANAMPRDIAQGLAAGFFRYVTKPIRVDELNGAIDSALAEASDRQRQASDRLQS